MLLLVLLVGVEVVVHVHVLHVVLDLSFHQMKRFSSKRLFFFLGKNNRQFKDTKREREKKKKKLF